MNRGRRTRKVLFVCGGDSRRSPMAVVILEQLLANRRLGGLFEAEGAARNQPERRSVHPYARQVIKERYGADLLECYTPKKLTKLLEDAADVIVIMEEYMKTDLPANRPVIILGISDPPEAIEKFRTCATEIERGILKNWANIVGETPSVQQAEAKPPRVPAPDPTGFSVGLNESMQKYGPQAQVDWVHDAVIKTAKGVEFGRGEHAKTVTRLMLNIYDDLVSVGLIDSAPGKRKLAEAIGLSHDIGVSVSENNHHYHGFQMLKKTLWNEALSSIQKKLLATVMYGVFYHRNKVPDGKLIALDGIPLEDYKATAELVSLIRVADGLNYGPAHGSLDAIEKIQMARTPDGVECRVFPRPGEDVAGLIWKSHDKREVFEATFGKLTFWLPCQCGGWAPWHPW